MPEETHRRYANQEIRSNTISYSCTACFKRNSFAVPNNKYEEGKILNAILVGLMALNKN